MVKPGTDGSEVPGTVTWVCVALPGWPGTDGTEMLGTPAMVDSPGTDGMPPMLLTDVTGA